MWSPSVALNPAARSSNARRSRAAAHRPDRVTCAGGPMVDAAQVQSAVWAPRRSTWWIGVLFAVGSTCFLVGPFPGFVELVGLEMDGVAFFVGAVFFHSPAT